MLGKAAVEMLDKATAMAHVRGVVWISQRGAGRRALSDIPKDTPGSKESKSNIPPTNGPTKGEIENSIDVWVDQGDDKAKGSLRMLTSMEAGRFLAFPGAGVILFALYCQRKTDDNKEDEAAARGSNGDSQRPNDSVTSMHDDLWKKSTQIVEGRCKSLKAYYQMLWHRKEKVSAESKANLLKKSRQIVEGRCKNLKAYYQMLQHRKEKVVPECEARIQDLEERNGSLSTRVQELEKEKAKRRSWPF